jgi:hypothetical protein
MTDPKAPKTVTLSEPIQFEGREIAEVHITKPKVKDLKRMNAALDGITDPLEQGIVMAASLTGLPVEVIEDLDADDFTTISEVIADFFPQGTARDTGVPSSPKPLIG